MRYLRLILILTQPPTSLVLFLFPAMKNTGKRYPPASVDDEEGDFENTLNPLQSPAAKAANNNAVYRRASNGNSNKTQRYAKVGSGDGDGDGECDSGVELAAIYSTESGREGE